MKFWRWLPFGGFDAVERAKERDRLFASGIRVGKELERQRLEAKVAHAQADADYYCAKYCELLVSTDATKYWTH